ncbi:hypothetical protein RF11_08017 [Thelohanellus kitauei]|uniref:Uncharacterized protein n=1 Tax=Thelohanellus kitauei TaxID=669202 RepID=A0A0C2MDY9_THEKT|nr:hypothetical protein RF11_08017 [Thelohanellus kitauei]
MSDSIFVCKLSQRYISTQNDILRISEDNESGEMTYTILLNTGDSTMELYVYTSLSADDEEEDYSETDNTPKYDINSDLSIKKRASTFGFYMNDTLEGIKVNHTYLVANKHIIWGERCHIADGCTINFTLDYLYLTSKNISDEEILKMAPRDDARIKKVTDMEKFNNELQSKIMTSLWISLPVWLTVLRIILKVH